MDNRPEFTIVAPVYNEIETLTEFYSQISRVMDKTGEAWELVLVDDGSKDGSSQLIRDIARKDPRVRPVIFARNFGHQIAVTAGMDYSRGKAVVVIDSDLQDPPEVILELIAKWREGYQVVYAVREEREGETWFKKFTASAFYSLIYKITDIKIPQNSGDFRLLDRSVVDVMNSMREKQRFLRGMSVWVGFKQIGVPYKRAARFAGVTKYPLKKMIKLAMNAITGFSYLPLQLATWLGFVITGVSVIDFIITIIIELTGKTVLTAQAVTLIAVQFLGGIQLICIGILGEYLGRVYDEVRNRPLYIVAESPDEGLSQFHGK